MAFTVNSDQNSGVSIFKSVMEMSAAFFDLLVEEFTTAISEKRNYHLALSGGTTPLKIFEYLARMPVGKMKWDFLHIYWSDERCVPSAHPESNYGNMWNTILRYLQIPEENIHQINGENDPLLESRRYSEVLRQNIPISNGIPEFDLVLLGVGEDGHTASVFPDYPELLYTDSICFPAVHPLTNQSRISFSLKLINNSKKVLFLVTGKSKADILSKIIKRKRAYNKLPAALVNPVKGELIWFIDITAASKIRKRFIFF